MTTPERSKHYCPKVSVDILQADVSDHSLELPDHLVERLRKHEERLPEILELGLRELHVEMPGGFEGATEILEFLAGLPSPQEILGVKPSERLRGEVLALLEKSRAGTLSEEDEQRWERSEFLEHLVRIAKSKAALKLGINTV